MHIILNEDTQKFIAKYLGDLSKAIVTVGIASYFFEKMPFVLRIGFFVIAIAFLVISIIITENKGGKKWKP